MSSAVSFANNDNWTHGIVAVLRSGRPVGAGFVVRAGDGTAADPPLVATCAHVLKDAGWSYMVWDEAVTLRFHGSNVRAQAFPVAEWYRDNYPDGAVDAADIAVLRLAPPLPETAKPLPLWWDAAGVTNAEALFYGYPQDDPEGARGRGTSLGPNPYQGHQRLQLESQQVTQGFSGGPVWHPGWQRVIGMVLSGRSAPDKLGRLPYKADAAPVPMLQAACDRLALSRPGPVPRTAGPIGSQPAGVVDTRTLNRNLQQFFSLEDLQAIAFDLDVEFEDIAGSNKAAKIRGFIRFLDHRGRLPELVALLQQERPDVAW